MGIIVFLLVLINAVVLKTAFISNHKAYWALTITLPLLLVAGFYFRRSRH